MTMEMTGETKRLYYAFSGFRELERVERETVSVISSIIADSLVAMEKGRAPDAAQLKAVKAFLLDNRDTEGIADEVIAAIDSYLKAGKKLQHRAAS